MAPQPDPLLAGLLSPLVGAHRLAKLAGKLEQEEQAWEVACGALQRSQEEASQRMDHEVARIQVPRQGAGIPAASWAAGQRVHLEETRALPAQPMSFLWRVLPSLQFSFQLHLCDQTWGVIRPALSNEAATSHRWLCTLKLANMLESKSRTIESGSSITRATSNPRWPRMGWHQERAPSPSQTAHP